MSEHPARPARDDVYNHEHDEPRSGRRRRPVADWGVGEDLFEHMPRNRFSRAAEAPKRERRFAREDAEPRGRVHDGRRTIRIGRDEDVPSEIAAITADRDIDTEEVAIPPSEAPAATPERRTVKIEGRPEGSLEASRYERDRARRPRRTAHERVAHRPDRIAMWAFALGLILILIAVLTAT